MTRKISWLILTSLMVVALVLTSCQPVAEEKEEAETVVGKVTETEKEGEVAEKAEEEEAEVVAATATTGPRYGGTLTIGLTADVAGFDPKTALAASCWTVHLTNENLRTGDWAKGPAGTGEDEWIMPGLWTIEHDIWAVGVSWEWPDNETIIYKIREGIHWQDKAPTFGRELTAEDVAYSIYRDSMDPSCFGWPQSKLEDKIISVQALDKTTVVVKTPPQSHGAAIQGNVTVVWIFPKELAAGAGVNWQQPVEVGTYTLDDFATDWRDQIGTGAYMVTDYVIDSSVTMARNPSYWREDPVNPGNMLPYPDRVRGLVIEDESTRISALRTGKIDQISGIEWDDGESLLRTNPELNYSRYLRHTSNNIFMRMDIEELPYDDIRVRRALSMAIDRDAMIEGLYNGNAEKYCHPILPVGALGDIFVPLEELPETAQELYQFNPEKAKQLLTEAGYPNGFKASIVCSNPQVDALSVIAAMWADINVELELDVKESGVWRSIQRSRGQEDMLMAPITNIYYYAPLAFMELQHYNRGHGVDQYVEDYYDENLQPYSGPVYEDILRSNLHELVPYLVDLAWSIETPTPYFYTMWHPWVGGYQGETAVGRGNHGDWPIYVWVDQDVKEYYTGQR